MFIKDCPCKPINTFCGVVKDPAVTTKFNQITIGANINIFDDFSTSLSSLDYDRRMAQPVEPPRWNKSWTIVCGHDIKCFVKCYKKVKASGIKDDLEIVARSLPNFVSLNTMFDAEVKSYWNGTQQFIENILRRRGGKTMVVNYY